MNQSILNPTSRARSVAALAPALSLFVALVCSACASVSSSSTTSSVSTASTNVAGAAINLPAAGAMTSAPSPDPRIGLRGGFLNAASAIWNMEMISSTAPPRPFLTDSAPGQSAWKSSDLAFMGNIVFQGNYSGWLAWDISNPLRPVVRQAYVCPGTQSDISVYRNLLFVSHESTAGRVDCGMQGVTETVSADRARGVRIYDISNLASPRRLTMVQTCRGSHTHTLVTDPNDSENVYIYVSGSAGVRSPLELAGCVGGSVDANPNTAEFRLEVIQVPLANPASARIVTSPRVFGGLTAPPPSAANASARAGGGGAGGAGRGAGGARGGRAAGGAVAGAAGAGAAGGAAGAAAGGAGAGGAPPARAGGGGRGGGGGGPSQCHDITVYPEIGLAGGACGGYGLLLDIRDVKNPTRIGAAADSNMSFWHSATFSNDGRKILFSDEWGGGTQARCRTTDKLVWGADAIFTIENNVMDFKGYYKMPAAQTDQENCVAHNGTLIPVPGREIMVQAWYQGGISVFDWTDPANAKEIAFFDRGPIDSTRLIAAGYWSAYWYNGMIVGSDEFRGLDLFELKPSASLSQNEIDAAKSVIVPFMNAQEQRKFVWPPSFAVARSYLDQLARGNGIARERAQSIAQSLAAAERSSGAQRRTSLTTLATQLDGDAAGARDAARVRAMATVVRELAAR